MKWIDLVLLSLVFCFIIWLIWQIFDKQEEKNRKRASNRWDSHIKRQKKRLELGLLNPSQKRGWILGTFEDIINCSYRKTTVVSGILWVWPEQYENLSCIDWYSFIRLIIISILFGLTCYPPHYMNPIFVYVVAFMIFWVWKDTVTVWISNHFLYRNPMSAVRALVMTGANGIEMVIIFAIGNFFARDFFIKHGHQAFNSPADAFYYSVGVLSGNDGGIRPHGIGLLPYYLEIFTGILFLVIVLSLVMSYFGKKEKT